MTSPSASDAGKSNWVTIWPSCSRRMIGMMSMSGSLDMITPAACTPHCRLRFSMPRAVSKTFAASASAPMRARRSAASLDSAPRSLSITSVSGMSLPMIGGGNALVSFSPTENGIPSTRVLSFSACFALIVP